MSPVALVLQTGAVTRVPVVDDPFRIGRDPGCELCLWDLRVSRRHARIARTDGGYELAAEGRHGLFVNGSKVPRAMLRDGDEIQLTPPGEPDPVVLRFDNALQGIPIGAGTSLTRAWLEREKDRAGPPLVVARFEVLGPLGGSPDAAAPRLARHRTTGQEVVLSVFPPVPVGASADSWLRFVTAVAGTSHPALAPVVDGGVDAVEEGAMRWLASTLVRGRAAAQRIAEGAQPPVTAVRRLRALSGGIHLLHTRGVVHANVSPSHVLLRTDGSAVLVGYGRGFLRRDGVFPGASPVLDRAYLAPELRDAAVTRLPTPAADVWGLAAVGHGMLTGRPPEVGGARLRDLGVTLPAALDELLARALDPDPGARPSAEDLGQALAFAEASLTTTLGGDL
jgi:hypothetical protein